ncbi:MAG TPA: amino acid adenylation domain-containing protein [Chloroflexi bacterium]|nr:amino acid adenylation domain-containing protein [Chloroflexota bacterium]
MNKKVNIEAVYALSPLQEGILFHTLYAPRSGVYFEHLLFRIEGPLDADAFRRAWQGLIDRHPILRTLFAWEGYDKTFQVVQRRVEVPWQQQAWRGMEDVERRERLDAFLQADRARGFDVSQAPLIRLTLIQEDEARHQFVWSHHHLLLDGWSVFLLLEEVFDLYAALRRGRQPSAPDRRPYRDYIAWLGQQDEQGAQAFWRQALAGMDVPTPLGVDRALPPDASPAQTADYLEHTVALPAEESTGLQALARRHRLTLNTLVQGAWAILLSRYSGRDDVVFGTTVSGRPTDLTGAESMVGLFINTLPVRVRLAPRDRLSDWLQHLQAQQVEMRQYEYCSLVKVREWSAIPGDRSLFDSLLVFENYPAGDLTWGREEGLQVVDLQGVERTNYPLTVVVVPDPELAVKFLYDRRRLDAATIARMGGHLRTLLTAMGDQLDRNPTQHLCTLPILMAAERQEILERWSGTETDCPHETCVHEIFEAQAARTPDAVALAYPHAGEGTHHLTYGALDARANRLARHLVALGVGPDAPVGLCMTRSVEMVTAMLAVLKAGGAYVPLDPINPAERLAFMMTDAGAQVVLTEELLLEDAAGEELGHVLEETAHVLCVDRDGDAIARQADTPLDPRTHADHLAYVMYTSGSTGRPKGIGIPHRGVNRLVLNTDYVQLDASDVVPQAANTSFDAATFEIWGPLLNGGRVVLVPEGLVLEHRRFVTLLREEAVTALFLTTALFNQFAREAPDAFATLRHVMFGGQAVDPESVRRVLGAGGPERLLHMYGPTESTTYATWYPVETVAADATTVPIGRAVTNTSVYVLDEHMAPVPVGVPGELYVGGDGLARGYLGQPAMTAERFVPDPFTEQRGGRRLYRTGDLVKWSPDGQLVFLGRIDFQVKVRGFRIELGEIEAVLGRHPDVQHVAVVARPSGSNGRDRQLVAYVVPNGANGKADGAWRAYLRERLPDYMVPAFFVLLDELPLNANGKVDRHALPVPDREANLAQAYAAPHTPVEKALVAIWTQVLPVDRVGVRDSFFALGGHSLLATQLISRIRAAFQVDLSIQDLFTHATIAELTPVLIAKETTPGRVEKAAELLNRLDGMSSAEIRKALQAERLKRGRRGKAQ